MGRGQYENRRKRFRDGEEENGEAHPKLQVLPVADLPEDYAGEIEDGATYLALANRANAALPFVSRVPNPFRQPSPSFPVGHPSSSHQIGADQSLPAQSDASCSRHPALPKDSWEVLFPLHFVGYRKHLGNRWPPESPNPYPSDYPPIPLANSRSDWYGYINGYPRKKVQRLRRPKREEVDEEAMMNVSTSEERAALTVEDIVDGESEEAMINNPPVLEDEEERHRSREPLVCILQSINSVGITRILSHLSYFLSESIDNLTPHVLLPSQPQSPPTPSSSSPTPSKPIHNPFPNRYARWIFALLSVLDTQLSGGEISTLRELARAAMKVGAWRWLTAVQEGEITEGDIWVFGQRWRSARDARPSGSGIGELVLDDETGVDETLARCWIVVHAVAAGWGQRDLVEELHTLFT